MFSLILTIYDQNCKILKRVARLEHHAYNDYKIKKQELEDKIMVFVTEKNEFDFKSREFTTLKKEFDLKQEEFNKKNLELNIKMKEYIKLKQNLIREGGTRGN